MKKEISIIIPAYNEENNIGLLLKSIFLQKSINFSMKEVIILIDGATDNTYERCIQFKNKLITIINGTKRIGKSARLNQGLSLAKSEIIILVDADVILSSKDTLDQLVKPFLINAGIGLVSGRAVPNLRGSFIEKAIYASILPYEEMAGEINNGSNIFACKGALLALSQTFTKSFIIPKNVFANDTFLYFSCIKNGYTFFFQKNAIASYHLPNTLKDHIKQNTRFIAAKTSMESLFGNIVQQEFKKGQFTLRKKILQQLLISPKESIAIFFINSYCKFLLQIPQNKIKSVWTIAKSTKR